MSQGAVTVERLERALRIVAYVVLRHGDVYAPILDRLQFRPRTRCHPTW